MNENDFYSIDRLIEFGMEMTIANQMVNSMNQQLRQMDIPGVGKVSEIKSEAIYYTVIDSKTEGPYLISEISRLILEKKIFKETYVWKRGMPQWDLAQNFPEILQLISIVPPPIPKL